MNACDIKQQPILHDTKLTLKRLKLKVNLYHLFIHQVVAVYASVFLFSHKQY